MSARPTRLLVAASCVLGVACVQSEDARQRSALEHSVPMVNPALSGAADPVVSSSWDSSYRMLSFSPTEACFLAEWGVPARIVPSVRFVLEGWRKADEPRSSVPSVASSSMNIVDSETVEAINANDPPVKDDTPPEIRAMRPKLTAMRVCFPSSVIGRDTAYLVIRLSVDDSKGRHHETGTSWRLVAAR